MQIVFTMKSGKTYTYETKDDTDNFLRKLTQSAWLVTNNTTVINISEIESFNLRDPNEVPITVIN